MSATYATTAAEQADLLALFGLAPDLTPMHTTPERVETPAPAKAQRLPMSERHYVRCHDCLSIVVIDRDPRTLTTFDADGTRHEAACSLCGGRIDYMGAVQGERQHVLTIAETICKCNEECISARGPICTCRCGGENHGHGLAAGYHTVQTPSGPVPTVDMPDSGKARAIAQTWRDALAAFDVIYRPLSSRYARREWLAPADFARFCELRAIRRKAAEMTSQAGRLRVLASATKDGAR